MTIASVFLLAFLSLIPPAASAGSPVDKPSLPPGLEPGPYSVGYTVQHHIDHTRTYGDKFDRAGRPSGRDYDRPIQISIWYPAEAGSPSRIATFGDYVDSLITEVRFDKTSDLRKRRFFDRIRTNAFGPEGGSAEDEARMTRFLRNPTIAIKDARPRTGRFPLLIYAPGAASQSFENSALCEFLASYGYVVAAFPCNGFDSRENVMKASDVEALIRDAEFVMDKGRDFANADPDKIGVIGYSWGSLVGLFLAARNAHIDARVGIEGAEIVADLSEPVRRQFPFYDAVAAIRVPSLVMIDASDGRPVDLRIYDRMKYAETRFLRFLSVSHGNFSGLFRWALVLKKDAALEEIARFDRVYALVGRYTLNFLEAKLKADNRGREFLDRSLEANGIEAGLLTVEMHPALPRPPMGEEFLSIVRMEGARAGRAIWATARKADPDIVVSSLRDLFVVGQDAYYCGRMQEAIDVFELAADACTANEPIVQQQSRLFLFLGRAYRKLGNLERARAWLKKAIDVYPDNAEAKKLWDELGRK